VALISFPRAIPDELGLSSLSFPPDPMIEVTPLRSGEQIAVDLGPTLWRGKWQSATLDETKMGIVRAWYDTLLSAQAFYGYDKLREYPLAYRAGFASLTVGGNPFSGVATLTGVASNNLQPTLGSLPAGFVFSPGDYIAFDYGSSKRALHRVSAAAVADGDGNVTLEVRPAIRPGWNAGAAVFLRRAAALMIILPGSYSEQIVPPTNGQISFEAIQTL